MAFGDADETAALQAIIDANQPGKAPVSAPVKTPAQRREETELQAIIDANQAPAAVAGAPVAPTAPVLSTPRGVVRNAAAGVLDADGNLINTAINPAGNLVGKPLATGLVFAHDALAPFLGYSKFPDDVRNLLLGDQVPQAGSALIDATGKAIGGASPEDVPVNGTAERLVRKGVTGAATMPLLGGATGVLPTAGAMVAGGAGAVAGDQAATYAPDWAKPAVEMGANALTTGASSRLASSYKTPINRDVAEVAQMARDQYGINLKTPQIAGPLYSHADSLMKFVPGYGGNDDLLQDQFNRAWSRLIGQDSDKVTPRVLAKAQTDIGNGLDAHEQATNVALDNTTVNNLARIEANAHSTLTDPEFAVIRRQLDGVLKNVQSNGTITGTTYGNLIGHGSPLDNAVKSGDSNVRNYAGQIKSELQDSLSRSMTPDDAADYRNLRTQYKNLKLLEPTMLRADSPTGASPSLGDVSPAAIRQAVASSYGPDAAHAAPGEIPAVDLMRIGQRMKEPKSSATAEHNAMINAGVKLVGTVGGLGSGYVSGAELLPMLGTLAGTAVGAKAAGSVMRSQWLANDLLRRSLPVQPGPTYGGTGQAIAGFSGRNPNPNMPYTPTNMLTRGVNNALQPGADFVERNSLLFRNLPASIGSNNAQK